jgi:hypothetical protein
MYMQFLTDKADLIKYVVVLVFSFVAHAPSCLDHMVLLVKCIYDVCSIVGDGYVIDFTIQDVYSSTLTAQ